MTRWIHRLRPYFLLALLALPALWPFTHLGLPRTNDNLPHLYRVVELDRLVREGVLFPRWAPDLVHGYGYPVFNFFPYLGHYLAEIFHLLGLNFLTAFKAASVLVLLCTAWFAFRLGREYFGEAAGLVTGTAYLYSPFILYDTHIRGSLPELLALALLPLALLYLRQAAHGSRRAVVWAGASLAACLFSHHGVTLQAMPFLVLYGLFEYTLGKRFSHWRSGRLRRIWDLSCLILPFVIALLLSAFFWLPALVEARYVQTERGTLNSAMIYTNQFFSSGEFLALPRLPVDPDLLNPPVRHSLPQAALVLSMIGLIVLFLRPRSAAPLLPSLVFFAVAALLATSLMLPPSRPLWDNAPLLRLTLFPWRLLGLISLFVALLAGAVFANYHSKTRQGDPGGHPLVSGGQGGERGGESGGDKPGGGTLRACPYRLGIWDLGFGIWDFSLLLTLFVLVLAGLPLASPPFEPTPAAPTLADVAEFEIPPDFIGTTTVGEYLPAWVRQLPDTSENRTKLMRGEAIQYFGPLPPGAQVAVAAAGARGHTFSVTAARPFTFVYRTFYFPGWRATLDGTSVPVRITDPEGLMAVDVPPGNHTLAFQFGGTPPRVIGTVLTLIGLVVCFALLVIGNWRLEIVSSALPRSPAPLLPRYPALFSLAVALALARPLLYDAGYTPLLRRGLTSDGLTGMTHPLNQDFVGELTLLGWEAEREVIGADDPLTVNLYFKANHKLGVAYGFQARLVDEDGLTWNEADTPRPRDWRFTPGTDFWPEDQYIVESYILTPLAGTPPGEYVVEVKVFAYYNLQSIGATRLGPVAIDAPGYRLCRDMGEAGVDSLSEGLILQHAEFSARQAAPGEAITASLCWSASASPTTDLAGELRLVDAQGSAAAAQAFVLGGRYPTSRWGAGQTVRDQVKISLPAAVETGDYHWEIQVGERALTLGALHVTAPERVFTAPPVEHALEANLGPVTLVGVNLPRAAVSPGQPVSAALVWKSNQVMANSYHVFVHLLNDDGALVAQSDGAPADWTRLTTGWLPGEFVSETRALNLPADLLPGTYPLFAGMYLPATGDRLTTGAFPDGRVPLGTVMVGP